MLLANVIKALRICLLCISECSIESLIKKDVTLKLTSLKMHPIKKICIAFRIPNPPMSILRNKRRGAHPLLNPPLLLWSCLRQWGMKEKLQRFVYFFRRNLPGQLAGSTSHELEGFPRYLHGTKSVNDSAAKNL